MKKTVLSGLLAICLIGCEPKIEKDKVFVQSEFAPLKKVVLAQSQLIAPKVLDPDILKILPPNMQDSAGKLFGKDFKEVFPELQKEWENERENLKKVLEKYGIEVLRPRLLTDYEKKLGGDDGVANFFARDPFFTIGNIIIEGSLRYKHRRNEILPIRHILEEVAYKSGAIYVSVPRPDISEGQNSEVGPFLEGGDVLVLDKTVFVGMSGQATNENGYQWLKNFLKHYNYEVIKVPLKNNVLHLDCALSIVRNGLIIVSEEVFLEGIPDKLKGWDKIKVPASDIAHLAVNGLPIDGKTYILDPEFKYIGDQLESRGIKTEYIDFKISRLFGGSFRCSTQPFVRAD
jgi:N-dimethylarginine dimethylaminohydrolase